MVHGLGCNSPGGITQLVDQPLQQKLLLLRVARQQLVHAGDHLHQSINQILTPAAPARGCIPAADTCRRSNAPINQSNIRSVLWIRIGIDFDRSDVDPHCECVSGSRRQKLPTKKKKK
jgi:hypothetical protein